LQEPNGVISQKTAAFRSINIIITYFKPTTFTAQTVLNAKNAVFWYVTPYSSRKKQSFGGKYRLQLRVARIGALETTLEVTNNRNKLRWLRSFETSVLQGPHGVTFQMTALFKVTAVKNSNLKQH
jgi:hypothetical protein